MQQAAALIDHACKLCGGRLLRTDSGVMCTCCEVAGGEPEDICYCGEDGCRCIVFEGHAPGVSPRIVPDWTTEATVPPKRDR